MSVARYTFFADSVGEEVTALLALPDQPTRADEGKNTPAFLLFPPKGREADYLMRAYTLEALGRAPYGFAAVSLPARLLLSPPCDLKRFFTREMTALANLFRLSLIRIGVSGAPDDQTNEVFHEIGLPITYHMTDPLALARLDASGKGGGA